MIKVAIIGLDTSHSVTIPKLMQDPNCPRNLHVSGMKAVACMRFETPYQNKEGLDKRQKELELLGVKVTADMDEALAGCNAIMLEINDGSLHLEYFQKVAALGKPVFMDKPLAMSVEDGRAIVELMLKHNTRVFSSSGVPFSPPLGKLLAGIGVVKRTRVFGPLNDAPAGDGLIWYGVHSFETLLRIMGPGARRVRAIETPLSIVAVVEYKDGREGHVELMRQVTAYGGVIHNAVGNESKITPFVFDTHFGHSMLLKLTREFFRGAPPPVDMKASFEALAMMGAARKSINSGNWIEVESL